MNTRRGALPLALLLGACAAPGGERAFLGAWSCTGGSFDLRFTNLRATVNGAVTPIDQVGSYGPNYTLDLRDGSRISLFDVTEDTLTYHRPATGETRDCIRS